MNDLQAIARGLEGPVGRLDALLVPMAHGARDGHGVQIAETGALRQRLLESMDQAEAAIVRARARLQPSTKAEP